MLCLQACVPTRNLGEDERLLVSIAPTGLETVDPTAIQALYQQKPNRMVLGSTPYLSLYNFGKKFYDPEKIQARIEKQQARLRRRIEEAGTDSAKVQKVRARIGNRIDRLKEKKKEGNFVMQLGEPPAIYDSTLMEETLEQIQIYLNSRGYFNNEVSYTVDDKDDKLVHVTLNIDENIPYRYTEFTYGIQDSAVRHLVQSTASQSLLQLGEKYNEEELTKERDRLYNLLRNSGYYDFARAYIEFEVDTSFADRAAQIKTIIQNPEQGNGHRAYRLNNVYFKTDQDRFGIPRDTIRFNGINYLAYDHKITPLILDQKVDLYPGQPYSQLRTATTQRKLADLDVFQFNNVVYSRVDGNDSTYLLNAYINAVPAKKFQETAEVGLNFTERTPGPFSSVRLRIRNVFGGAENLDIGLRGGIEGQVSIADPDETVIIREYGGEVALSFPVILLPFTEKRLLSDFGPRTRIFTGYLNTDRQEYTRETYELGLEYIWQRYRAPLQPPIMQFILSPINFNVVQGEIKDPVFEESLQNTIGGRSLLESFRDGIISFVGFNFIYNTNDFTQTKDATFFRTLAEVGGLTKELGLDLNIGNLTTFQYARLNPDYRRYIPLGGRRYFAYRFNAGVASSLFNSGIIPYDKHFFAGGASSVRAWQYRRLGLGSYTPTVMLENGEVIADTVSYVEQPGNVLFETSAEYRFNMFSFINGAVFVDAGNVWLLEEDPARPGAEFDISRFYKELAVGTGFGIRFDLSVLILRFDFATKVYDPTALEGEKFRLGQFKFSDFFTRNNQSTLQIGIGYPF
ncbi:outer membrane protein assembly factor BamA [Pontibacter ummariensis]|uniref:Outer membrane protein assembly factor BamA n=2 Tax=Pontibacter ummariensis TaxID=1610492 RepID=A0A239BUV3_9BACT|nr:outer membrane protein assembly factor BamA [Pontibacter ummariensis]SNS10953.1 Outer membrane protein assembly factor BamA [Pontibacter ummariensis]